MTRKNRAGETMQRWVRVVGLPPRLRELPRETQRVFRHCLGKTFRVTEAAPHGWLGLDVGTDVDQRFRGKMNEIWLEPELVRDDEPRLNRARGGPSLDEAVHIVHGASALTKRKESVLTVMDNLAYGPAANDPGRHLELRRGFWRAFEKSFPIPPGQRRHPSQVNRWIIPAAEVTHFVKRRRGRPIVVWVGNGWMERLFLWWTCDSLVRSSVGDSAVWLATPSNESDTRINIFPLPDLARFFSAAKPFRRGWLKTGQRMWRAYAASVPRGMA